MKFLNKVCVIGYFLLGVYNALCYTTQVTSTGDWIDGGLYDKKLVCWV